MKAPVIREGGGWLRKYRVGTLILLAGLILSVHEIRIDYNCLFHPKPGMATFSDMNIFLTRTNRYPLRHVLYPDPPAPGFFTPGSSVYKYPPPLAALLWLSRLGNNLTAIHTILIVDMLVLAAALAVLLSALRPGLDRSLLLILAFVLWAPFYESLGGPQVEPLLLLCLSLAGGADARGRRFVAGFLTGVAGAFKVYPLALAFMYALRRHWRAVVGAAAGAVAVLVAADLVLARPNSLIYLGLLPRLGGIDLRWENIGLQGILARLAGMILRAGEGGPLPGSVLFLAKGVSLLILAGLSYVTARCFRRAGSRMRDGWLVLSSAICLLLLVLPTSWGDYQTLLFLPVAAAVTFARRPGRDPLSWILIGAALLCCSTPFVRAAGALPQEASNLLRAWVPVGLWVACIRIASAKPVEDTGVPRLLESALSGGDLVRRTSLKTR